MWGHTKHNDNSVSTTGNGEGNVLYAVQSDDGPHNLSTEWKAWMREQLLKLQKVKNKPMWIYFTDIVCKNDSWDEKRRWEFGVGVFLLKMFF